MEAWRPQRRNTSSLKGSWRIDKIVEHIDAFGYYLPAFNLGGRAVVKTTTGGIFTAMIAILMVFYASLKL